MKKRLLTAALAACLSFTPSCAPNAAGGGNSANGSLGVSRDDTLLFVADSDLDQVFVVDAKSQTIVSTIAVGRQPEKVLVGPDDTVYVTNRLGRSVSIIRKGDTEESARIAVGVEPVGLAASSDGKTLYVVNATSLHDSDFGTLMAIDTATLSTKWETPVGTEPRAISLMGDGKAAISLYKSGDLVMVDLGTGKVVKSGTDLYTALNASALGITTTNQPTTGSLPMPGKNGFTTAQPRGMEAMVVSPDGKQLYVASLISTNTVLNTSPSGNIDLPFDPSGGGSSYGGGSCGTTSVSAPAILSFDQNGNALVDDLQTCNGALHNERPPMLLTSPIPGLPIQGPRAIAMEATGKFLFIANYESNNVAVVSTSGPKENSSFGTNAPDDARFGPLSASVDQLVSVGAGPSGIAVTHQGSTAYVYNSFDHSISTLTSVNGRVSNTGTTVLGKDSLSTAAAAGRRLFFSAVDQRMNNPATGISCGTCHFEGREDGHVWNFPEGPRQTPSLQGRMTTQTAPFHWTGEFDDLLAFMSHTVTNRMGGSGVTPVMEEQVAAFIDSMPLADNPHAGDSSDAVVRGKTAFAKAECNSCHKGAALTDNSFADVGTLVTEDQPTLFPHGGLNTPSLLGIARTSPYLHDGSATSLKARIVTNQAADKHGKTSRLNDGEVDDLVSYLKTL